MHYDLRFRILGILFFGAPVCVVVGAAIWIMPHLPDSLMLRAFAGTALMFSLAAIWGIMWGRVPISYLPTPHQQRSSEKHGDR
jgi:hypothetical protein